MGAVPYTFDLRKFYPKEEVRRATEELRKDVRFQEEMKRRGVRSFDSVFTTTHPLKYLGIELGGGKKRHEAPRFSLATAVRIALRPRSNDGESKGLRLSNHRKAFVERFPDVDAALSSRTLFAQGPKANLESKKSFAASAYAKAAAKPLRRLESLIGLPVKISLQVLRKGLAAYRRGHRPGMTAHGWARARLTSFVMKGCTHFSPDHELVQKSRKKSETIREFWDGLACLCRKRSQCGRPGKRTRANAPHDAT